MPAADLLTGLLASVAMSAILGRKIGPISDARPTSLTPRDGAFQIWGVLYVLLFASVIAQFWYAREDDVDALATAALLGTAAWVPLFVAQLDAVAFAVLAGGTAMLLASLGRGEGKLLDVPFSLLAGWLLVATAINLAMLVQRVGGDASWMLVPTVVGASVASLWLRDVALLLPVMWAVAWQKEPTGFEQVFSWSVLALAQAGSVCRRVTSS